MHKSKQSEIEECKSCRRLNDNDDRNAKHKFDVLCFVANKQHSQKHRYASAECRQNKNSRLGDPQLNTVELGYFFIVEADDHGNDRDYRNVCDKYRQKEIVLNEFRHIIVFL